MMYMVEQYRKEHDDMKIETAENAEGELEEVRIFDKKGNQTAWVFAVEVPVHSKKSDTGKLSMSPILKWLE